MDLVLCFLSSLEDFLEEKKIQGQKSGCMDPYSIYTHQRTSSKLPPALRNGSVFLLTILQHCIS